MLGIARIAAIGAAKRTSDLIPLCHPLPLTRVAVDFELDEAGPAVRIEVVAETRARTGVEMEALTAAAVGLLTVYDMCKAADRGMRIGALELVEKTGRQVRALARWRVAVKRRRRVVRPLDPSTIAPLQSSRPPAHARTRADAHQDGGARARSARTRRT